MILRARNLFLAWLTYGALQLALLGLPGAAAEPGIGARGARPQSETQSVSFGKRATLPDLAHRRALFTPFVPSAQFRLDVSFAGAADAVVAKRHQAAASAPVALPLARAPPTLS
jgi:hypothetical protein